MNLFQTKSFLVILLFSTLLFAACRDDESTTGDSDDSSPGTDVQNGLQGNGGTDATTDEQGDENTDTGSSTNENDNDDNDTTNDTLVVQPPSPSSGCGQTPPTNGEKSIISGSVDRTFIVDSPGNYDPDSALPVVFGFHGMGGSGSMFRSAFYGNLLSSMGNEAILVHPDGLVHGDTTRWDVTGTTDINFVDDMLDWLKENYCVDENKIFATGHSFGGYFSNALGCARGDVLRGIAPAAGGPPGAMGGGRNPDCAGQLAVWISHGDPDATVAFAQGEASLAFWLDANNCDAAAVSSPDENGCVSYTDCDPGYPVKWCVHNEGHNWPSYSAASIWDFFSSL